MDTVSLILLVVVVGMALIACFLAIRLSVKKSSAVATTTPAGGATTPPATSVWKRVTTALEDVFSAQMIAVMAAFAALEFALWNSGWLPRPF